MQLSVYENWAVIYLYHSIDAAIFMQQYLRDIYVITFCFMSLAYLCHWHTVVLHYWQCNYFEGSVFVSVTWFEFMVVLHSVKSFWITDYKTCEDGLPCAAWRAQSRQSPSPMQRTRAYAAAASTFVADAFVHVCIGTATAAWSSSQRHSYHLSVGYSWNSLLAAVVVAATAPLLRAWGGPGRQRCHLPICHAMFTARGRLQHVSSVACDSSMQWISSLLLLLLKCIQFHANAVEHASDHSQTGIVHVLSPYVCL